MGRTRWLLLVAAVVLGAFAIFRILQDDGELAETVTVTRGPLAVTIDEEGKTEVHDRYVVASPITGRLTRIRLLAGDSVREGAPIAEIRAQPLDPRAREEAQARLEASIDAGAVTAAGVASAKASLAQAQRDLTRNEHLAAGNAISAQVLEQSRLTVKSLEEELRAAEASNDRAGHEVDAARSALVAAGPGGGTPVVVRAPVSGRVLHVLQPSERVVLVGAALIEIGNPAHLDIVVEMLSEDAVRVSVGDTMLVTGWGGDTALVARVERVEPHGFTKVSALGIEEQRVRVVGALPRPPAALGDGFRVETNTVLWHGDSVLQVPSTALFQHEDAWQVFALGGGRARVRPVKLGRRGSTMTAIEEGLAVGDTVIRHPSDRISDGVRVRPLAREN
jgi:HlyD family secretion protein